jgi:hypothetical protein
VKQRLLTLLGDGARARILAVRAMLRRKLRNIGPDGQRTFETAETSEAETSEHETDEHSDLPHLNSSDVADDDSSSNSSGSSSGAGSRGPALA